MSRADYIAQVTRDVRLLLAATSPEDWVLSGDSLTLRDDYSVSFSQNHNHEWYHDGTWLPMSGVSELLHRRRSEVSQVRAAQSTEALKAALLRYSA